MNYPQKELYHVFCNNRSTTLTAFTPIDTKIKDIVGTYFPGNDEDDIDRTHAIESAQRFYQWLQNQEAPGADVSGKDAMLAWTFEKEGDFIGKSILCSVDPEQQIEIIVAEVTKDDPTDQQSTAYVMCGVCIDLMHWLNRQVPAVMNEKSLPVESADGEHYFVCYNDDGGQAIKFSKSQVMDYRDQHKCEVNVETYSNDGEFINRYLLSLDSGLDNWLEI